MTISRRTVLKSMASAGALALPQGVFAPAIAQAGPVKIGILAPRSGIAASAGISGLRATEWAVERFNARAASPDARSSSWSRRRPRPRTPSSASRSSCSRTRSTACRASSRPASALALGPVVEEARALTIFWDGTTQDGVEEKMPNPKYLFRSTDNECEAVMSSLLAIKHWKGQFKRIAGINPDYSYGRNNMAAFVALLKRFNIEHEVVTEQWPKVGTMELTSHVAALKAAKPDLIFSSLLFADLPVFMKQAHAAELTKGTKLVFPAAGWQHTLMKKDFTPEGMLFGHNTLYFDNPNALAVGQGVRRLVRRQAQGLSELGSRPRLFRHRLLQGGGGAGGQGQGRQLAVAATTSSPPWSASRSRASAARAPGARTTSPTRPSCRASPPTRTSTTSSRSTPGSRPCTPTDLQKPAGANFWEWIKTAQFKV